MVLIAQNHLQFIIEVWFIMISGIMLVFNIVPISLSFVLFLLLLLSIGLTALFGFDAFSLLFLHFAHEFAYDYGPIALFAIVTLLAALPMMREAGIRVANLRIFVFLLIGLIALVGGLVHREFYLLWVMGLLIGLFIISKSFRQKSFFTLKRVIMVFGVMGIGFGFFELLSVILNMPVLSPLLRLTRLEEDALPSLTMVLKNATLFGHAQGSSYWGTLDTGFSSGYISLPLTLIIFFSLPFPLFYGILENKKDVIDYFVPGTFGYAYDFGYVTMICLLIFCVAVILIGFKILMDYREKRESGNRNYLGREALLIGALTAFTSQAIIGLFYQNREINGTALVVFMFLSSMILCHVLLVKNKKIV